MTYNVTVSFIDGNRRKYTPTRYEVDMNCLFMEFTNGEGYSSIMHPLSFLAEFRVDSQNG